MTVASVAGRVKIHEESAWRILAHHVNEAIERIDLSSGRQIGVVSELRESIKRNVRPMRK
jgi:hypothetical protein